VIDATTLRPGDRFKCAKCKKLMTFGPHLFTPQYADAWRTTRTAALLLLIATTVWCVTVGYDFGSRSGHWGLSLGGSLAVWLLAVGCIVLAASTTQNLGVLVGVGAAMNGLALFFIERLGRHVGYNVAAWRERFRAFELWAPGLLAVGFVILTASLIIQARRRSV
jgi:hypothetical protein